MEHGMCRVWREMAVLACDLGRRVVREVSEMGRQWWRHQSASLKTSDIQLEKGLQREDRALVLRSLRPQSLFIHSTGKMPSYHWLKSGPFPQSRPAFLSRHWRNPLEAVRKEGATYLSSLKSAVSPGLRWRLRCFSQIPSFFIPNRERDQCTFQRAWAGPKAEAEISGPIMWDGAWWEELGRKNPCREHGPTQDEQSDCLDAKCPALLA